MKATHVNARTQTGDASHSLTAPASKQRVTHTPGPWQLALTDKGNAAIGTKVVRYPADGQRKYNSRALTVRDMKIEGVLITKLEGSTVPLAENMANAYLISAAPELLAACRAALEWGLQDIGSQAEFDAIHDQLESAIAKAEGQ